MKICRWIANFTVKLLAMLIPLAVAGGVIFNQIETRQVVLESKQEVVAAIAQLNTSEKEAEIIADNILVAIDEVIDNDLNASLELLIGLFSIIISVWVGLNIYNIMKKDDYNELLDVIEEEWEKLNELRKKVKKTHSGNMQMHVSYLYKTFDVNNNSSQYFYSMFAKIDVTKLYYEFLLNATFLETIYVKLTTIHEKNEHSKMKPYLEEGKRRCEEMLKWIEENGDKVSDKNKLLGYVTYRYGRMFFYQGMMAYYTKSDTKGASDNFMNAVKKFEASIEFDSEISENIDIHNTLGYIYIKVHQWNTECQEPWYPENKLEEIINDALRYCKSSKQQTANSLKNLGIVYERKNDLQNAMKKYKDAIMLEPHDYKSRICFASAFLKQARDILGITEDRSVLLCDMSFTSSQANEAKKHIDDAEFQLDIAQKIDAQSANYYYKMGQLYTYRFLLESETKKKYELKEAAIKSFEIANSINPLYRAHKFHERNFYEAIKDINHALKINNDLNGRDVEHLNRLYEKKLNSE